LFKSDGHTDCLHFPSKSEKGTIASRSSTNNQDKISRKNFIATPIASAVGTKLTPWISVVLEKLSRSTGQ